MSLPREMTVVEIAAPGGPEQLRISQRPVPEPQDGEVLVRVAAEVWWRCVPGSIGPMSCSVKVDIRRRREPPICPDWKSPGRSSLWDPK